jgi:hypothetical protein
MDIASIIYECKVKPNTYALVCRPDWKGLKNVFDSHIKLAEPSRVEKINSVYHFQNGSKIYFKVINKEEDKERVRGMQFDFFDVDSIDSEWAAFVLGRIR